jgi:hypothetical protein
MTSSPRSTLPAARSTFHGEYQPWEAYPIEESPSLPMRKTTTVMW